MAELAGKLPSRAARERLWLVAEQILPASKLETAPLARRFIATPLASVRLRAAFSSASTVGNRTSDFHRTAYGRRYPQSLLHAAVAFKRHRHHAFQPRVVHYPLPLAHHGGGFAVRRGVVAGMGASGR